MSIRKRMAVTIGGLLSLLLAVSLYLIVDATMRLSEAGAVGQRISASPGIAALMHELQRERGMSAGYLASRAGAFRSELAAQRSATDEAVIEYHKEVSALGGAGEIGATMSRVEDALNSLDIMRRSVDRLEAAPKEMVAFYSEFIAGLLALASDVANGVRDPAIAREAAVLRAILVAKEKAGQERAAGNSGYAAGAFDVPTLTRLTTLIGEQEAALNDARHLAAPELQSAMDQLQSSPVVERVKALRAKAAENLASGVPLGIPASDWFAATTDRIEQMNKVAELSTNRLVVETRRYGDGALMALIFWSVAGVACLALSAGLCTWLNRTLVKPLVSLIDRVREVGGGRTDVVIPEASRPDELGQLGRALDTFRANIIERERLETAERRAASERDQRRTRLEKQVADFRLQAQTAMEDLKTVATQMFGASAEIVDAADRARSGAKDADGATDATATAANSVAAAVEELSASIREISGRTSENQTAAVAASRAANDMKETAQKLDSAANAIGGVITLIAEIASQTNLLALNATIEAARAGEAGRGFAIVAAEVKRLSEQTAKATSEIAEQIRAIQEQATGSVSRIDAIGGSISQLLGATTAIAAAVEEQTAATDSISQSVHEAANGSHVARESVRGLSNSIHHTAGVADQVRGASSALTRTTDNFREVVANFLNAVAA